MWAFLIPALLGAAIGGFSSAMNDRDPLLGAGLGGLFGAATGGIGQWLAPIFSGAAGAAGSVGAEALAQGTAAAMADPLVAGPEMAFEGALATQLPAEVAAAETVPAIEMAGVNASGMEPWWEVPQFMQYGGEWGSPLNQAEYIYGGLKENVWPGIKAGLQANDFIGGQQQQQVNMPNYAMAYSGASPSFGRDIGIELERLKPLLTNEISSGLTLGGSSLGDYDYGYGYR